MKAGCAALGTKKQKLVTYSDKNKITLNHISKTLPKDIS
jgi:hypothetical protein